MPDELYWKGEHKIYFSPLGRTPLITVKMASIRDMLVGNVSDPDLWIKKAENGKVVSGKVYQDELTHTLLEGVGRLEVKQNCTSIHIFQGNGGLLGGMDAESTYDQITKEQYDILGPLIVEFDKADDLHNSIYWGGLSGHPGERDLIPDQHKESYDNCLKRVQAANKLMDDLGIKVKIKEDFQWVDDARTMALYIPEKRIPQSTLDKYPMTANNYKGIKYNALSQKVIQQGLAANGCKAKDIKRIYYSDLSVVGIVQMKDGNQFLVAPMMREDFYNGDLRKIVLEESRNNKSKKRDALMKAFHGS